MCVLLNSATNGCVKSQGFLPAKLFSLSYILEVNIFFIITFSSVIALIYIDILLAQTEKQTRISRRVYGRWTKNATQCICYVHEFLDSFVTHEDKEEMTTEMIEEPISLSRMQDDALQLDQIHHVEKEHFKDLAFMMGFSGQDKQPILTVTYITVHLLDIHQESI